jgi:preprotein translocase subunit SecG
VQALLPYVNVAEILVSILLIVLILMQTRGMGLAAGYSSDSSIFRTRRGFERTLFQLTIAVAVVFLILAILSVVVPRFES